MNCCDQPGLLPVDQAINQLLDAVAPITESEVVSVADALGRVLSEDVIALVDVPPANNSAMDGYVLRFADVRKAEPTDKGTAILPISQRIPAGKNPEPLEPGSAARIFTGAEIPLGADTVVMQEQCTSINDGEAVEFPVTVCLGDHIRPKGQDITSGSAILKRGHKLQPQDLGLMASIGLAEVKVYRRLKLAVLSTGDEIVEPGTECGPGHIYNSNRYTLAGLIDAMGMERIDLGIVPDDAEATDEALRKAAAKADCIITTGGVSVGEEDHVKACVERLGELQMWRLAIKPGKPLAFGRVLDTPFFGLPGNPGAVFVTFAIAARPYLLRYQGVEGDVLPLPLRVKANFDRTKAAPRQEYLRARLDVDEQGVIGASMHNNQSSGALSAASWGNGFAVQPINQLIAAGDSVQFIPFSELFA